MIDVYQARALDLFERFVKAYEQKASDGGGENTNRVCEAWEFKEIGKLIFKAKRIVPQSGMAFSVLTDAEILIENLIQKHEGSQK